MTGVNTIDKVQNGYTADDDSFEDLSPEEDITSANTAKTAVNSFSGAEIMESPVSAAVPPKGAKIPENMLRNARFHTCSGLTQHQIAAIDNMRAPRVRGFFANLFSGVGRTLVRGINAVRARFSGVNLSGVLRERTDAIRHMTPVKISDLPPETAPVSMDNEQMGRLTGLGNDVRLVPFVPYDNEENRNASELQKMLFPHGEPRLSDIKQNPKLQDCWFLSSIASVLNTQGTESITRLFSPSNTEGNVLIRLGSKQYDVPLGRYACGSENFGSKSANGVVALENAMQMHLLTSVSADDLGVLLNNSDIVNIRIKDMGFGSRAILGDSVVEFKVLNPEDRVDEVKDAIRKGQPVSIGHRKGVLKALANGISPEHAVSVMGMTPNEDALIILDPYGEVKKLPFSALSNCVVSYIETAQQPR